MKHDAQSTEYDNNIYAGFDIFLKLVLIMRDPHGAHCYKKCVQVEDYMLIFVW